MRRRVAWARSCRTDRARGRGAVSSSLLRLLIHCSLTLELWYSFTMETAATTAHPATPGRRPAIWWWSVTMLALSLAAFFPTYFGRFPGFEGTSAAVHFHVATMLAWLALTIAQPILIRGRRIGLHRQLGRLAYALLPVVAVGFWLVMR